jgi:hypothetical protein
MIMPVFDFALRLNRAPTDDEIEVLYEVTGGDGDVEWNPDTGYGAVTFNREAGLAAACGALMEALNGVAPVQMELPTLPAREPGAWPRPGASGR